MEQELEDRLRHTSKEYLLLLIQELTVRYPILQTEIAVLIEKSVARPSVVAQTEEVAVVREGEGEDDIGADWDFGGEEVASLHPLPTPVVAPLDREVCTRRVDEYVTRLQQGELLQTLASDLDTLLDEAEVRAARHDYQGAMNVYAIVLDQRLAEHNEQLTQMFDKAIDDIMPILETLLSEASSNILFEAPTLTPLLTPATRQEWLERLFALWLRRLDIHHVEENVPEIMLNVAWSEDVTLLRRLVQNELQQQPISERSNIVDFAQQYRTRTLEKFLKELPRT